MLKAKYDAGAEFAVTEMVLRASDYVALVERAEAVGRRPADHPGHHADPEPALDGADGRALAAPAADEVRARLAPLRRRPRRGCAPRGSRSPPSCATSSSTPARRACTSTRSTARKATREIFDNLRITV